MALRMLVACTVVLGACAREPVAPAGRLDVVHGRGPRAAVDPAMPIGVLLDSFSIGGVYTVLPRGGYSGGTSYAPSPEKDVYAGSIRGHPTGLAFPIGLPVRVLAEGRLMSRSTPAFQHDYCARLSAWDPICGVGSYEYSVNGLAPIYEPGTGLALAWSRTAGYYDRFFGIHPSAEFFRGHVPAADTLTRRELHFNRVGCCYYAPWGTTVAWETYEGTWRFGAVPDDGGRPEHGVPALLRLHGPRTDAPLAAPADFTIDLTTGDSILATRWWYVRAANNVFDGERVDTVPSGYQFPRYIPRYPDAQRSAFTELGACAGRTTCSYQATQPGAVVVQATMPRYLVLAARNSGQSPPADSLLVNCPGTVVRGASVTCTIQTTRGETPFSVDSILSVPYPLVIDSVVDGILFPPGLPPVSMLDSAVRVAAGGSYSFGGVVVLDAGISVFGHLLVPGVPSYGSIRGIALPRAVRSVQSNRHTPTTKRNP